MSSNTNELFARLRELISDPSVNLTGLSNETMVSYDKLRRFKLKQHPLGLAEAEAVYLKLTGKTFINIDHA
jgi:hypothetical protein